MPAARPPPQRGGGGRRPAKDSSVSARAPSVTQPRIGRLGGVDNTQVAAHDGVSVGRQGEQRVSPTRAQVGRLVGLRTGSRHSGGMLGVDSAAGSRIMAAITRSCRMLEGVRCSSLYWTVAARLFPQSHGLLLNPKGILPGMGEKHALQWVGGGSPLHGATLFTRIQACRWLHKSSIDRKSR